MNVEAYRHQTATAPQCRERADYYPSANYNYKPYTKPQSTNVRRKNWPVGDHQGFTRDICNRQSFNPLPTRQPNVSQGPWRNATAFRRSIPNQNYNLSQSVDDRNQYRPLHSIHQSDRNTGRPAPGAQVSPGGSQDKRYRLQFFDRFNKDSQLENFLI